MDYLPVGNICVDISTYRETDILYFCVMLLAPENPSWKHVHYDMTRLRLPRSKAYFFKMQCIQT